MFFAYGALIPLFWLIIARNDSIICALFLLQRKAEIDDDCLSLFLSLWRTVLPMPVEHYENFPVASFLLPKALRAPIEAIYHFARTADDIADEGDDNEERNAWRLRELAHFSHGLESIAAGERTFAADFPYAAIFTPLARAVADYRLPLALLHDLLSAFRQDVVCKRHADQQSVLDYCRRSANPVGRLLLHLFGQTSPPQLAQSDAICSALQLINFYQDVALDWQKNRVYLPQAELRQFGVSETDIAAQTAAQPWQALMRFQCQRARELMLSGAPLVHSLPGRVGWEIRATVQGGLRILEKIDAVAGDVFRHRPQLSARDTPLILWRALRM